MTRLLTAGSNDPLVDSAQSSRVYPSIHSALRDAIDAGVVRTGIQGRVVYGLRPGCEAVEGGCRIG